MEIHRYADLIPPMSEEEYLALKKSIREHGQLDRIVIHEGAILDGRRRDHACRELGIEPRYETYEGNDPAGYVLDRNINRRHLNESQRSMVAAEFAKLKWGQKKADAQICASQAEALIQELISIGVRVETEPYFDPNATSGFLFLCMLWWKTITGSLSASTTIDISNNTAAGAPSSAK